MADLRVLTLNVCGLPWFRPPLSERAALFCRRIESSDVDVAMFQEVWSRHTLNVLRSGLPSFRHVATRRGIGTRPAGGVATFSRLPLARVGFRSYRGLFPRTGPLSFRLNRAINSILQGVLVTELEGRDIAVANTHLTANKDGDWSAGGRYHAFQLAQLNRLHTTLRRHPPGVTILGGDFNLASDGALYPHIVGHGTWHDPFADSDPSTFHARFLPPGSAPHRIDYLLVRGDASVRLAEPWFTEPVTLDGGQPEFVSDHVALFIHIGLPDS
jgi:endonuclease/exonuclease/phosphatase family metal-dependent hydrolase